MQENKSYFYSKWLQSSQIFISNESKNKNFSSNTDLVQCEPLKVLNALLVEEMRAAQQREASVSTGIIGTYAYRTFTGVSLFDTHYYGYDTI
jgi:hypothetical protein